MMLLALLVGLAAALSCLFAARAAPKPGGSLGVAWLVVAGLAIAYLSFGPVFEWQGTRWFGAPLPLMLVRRVGEEEAWIGEASAASPLIGLYNILVWSGLVSAPRALSYLRRPPGQRWFSSRRLGWLSATVVGVSVIGTLVARQIPHDTECIVRNATASSVRGLSVRHGGVRRYVRELPPDTDRALSFSQTTSDDGVAVLEAGGAEIGRCDCGGGTTACRAIIERGEADDIVVRCSK